MQKFKFKYSNIIILLALYVPFEVLLLKYLPVSDNIYSMLRFVPELIIYLLLIIKLVQNIYHGHWLSKTPIDIFLLLFLLSALISIAINSSSIILSIITMRTLLRYVALYYLVSCIDIPVRKIKYLLFSLIAIGGIESLVTCYQHFVGISQAFYPRASELEVAGVQSRYKILVTTFGGGLEQGAAIGTFGDSVLLALFLLFVVVISYGFILRLKIKSFISKSVLIGIFILALLALFYTYSRASVLAGVLAIPILLFLDKRIKKLFFIGIMSCALLAIVLFGLSTESTTDSSYYNPKKKYTNPIANITSIFSESYVQKNLDHSRGWIIMDIGVPIVKSFNLFGYGPAGEESLGEMVKENVTGTMPFQNLGIINDVYWIGMLSYYGFIGLILFFFILGKIYKASILVYKYSPVQIYSIIGLCMAAMVILAIPYTFIIRTFAFRPFAFYFWLLAGLVAAEHRRIKMNQQEKPETT
ncbi:MAG TPA: O-antigen ligase family protein [Bacteroidia bacterium]|nr:O-antigen ligase family protein [Bacteroidia bacterium]